MNKAALIIFNLVLMLTTASAQNSWTNRYSGLANDEATAIALDSTGNVFVTGYSRGSSIYNNYATIKYSNSGVPLWTNRYIGPGNGDDIAYGIAVDNSGNVFVTGKSFGSSFDDYATIKYSNGGVPLWTNRYNGPGNSEDVAFAIAVDDSGNVFVTGLSTGSGSSYDYATIAYSGAGVPLWTNRFNGQGNSSDVAIGIAEDGEGNLFVTGYSMRSSLVGSEDFATIKYSNAGVPLWTNYYNGPVNNSDAASALAVDGDGNVFVTGSSMGSGSEDYATIKYSNAGAPLWTNRYNGTGNSYDIPAFTLAVDSTGNVFVTGRSMGENSEDYATIGYSGAGVPLWTNRYDGPGNSEDRATGIAVDSSDNVIVTGYSLGSGGDSDYATIAYSTQGTSLWTNRFNGLGNDWDVATAIAVDGNDNVFVTGYSTGGNYDYATIKYAGMPLNAILENWHASASEFSFDLVAETGGRFAIQVSTNLVNWVEIRQVMIPAAGRTNILETLAPGLTQRFYRARLQ